MWSCGTNYEMLSWSMGSTISRGNLAGNLRMSSAGGKAGHSRGVGAEGWQYLVSQSLGRGLRGNKCSWRWLRAMLVIDVPIFLLLSAMTKIITKISAMRAKLTMPATSTD